MELLLISARILAALHSGMIEGLSCSSCDEYTQTTLNCDVNKPINPESTSVYCEEGMGLDLPTCPILMITVESLAYMDEYRFYKIFNKFQYDYNTIPKRFWEFITHYKECLGEFKNMKAEELAEIQRNNRSSSGNTDSNLGALKAQFLKK